MARRRKYGEDLTYAEAHRLSLEELYPRIGHRLDMADRDWTEFCHYCKQPLALLEEVRDNGQDLNDKATTVTRKLAQAASVPAWLLAWRTERPLEIQRRIDELHAALRELESRYPIVGFTAKPIAPAPGALARLSPAEWWKFVLSIHRRHHLSCPRAKAEEAPVKREQLFDFVAKSPMYVTP